MMAEPAGSRVMVVGPETRLRSALASTLAGHGAQVFTPDVVEFDMAREAGAARAFAAFEPDAVVCLGVQSPSGGVPGGRSLTAALASALVLMDRSNRAGVRRFAWLGGAWPEADRVLASVLREYGEHGGLDGTVVVPDPAGPEIDAESVVEVLVDSLSGGGSEVTVRLPGRFTDAPVPARGEGGPGFRLPPVEEITDGDQVIAIILRGSLATPGVSFYSRDHFSQQLGFIHHPAGHVIPPHVHNPVPREVTFTQETLFVREGRVRVDLYRDDRTLLTRRVLVTGDVILLCTGGHGFEVLEESSIIEVKQGPYAGDGDKTRFEAAE